MSLPLPGVVEEETSTDPLSSAIIRGMPADFTLRFRVRFDECAPDSTARASALLRYVIETAFAHSTHEGFPLTWYDSRGLYWLVRYVRLDLDHPVPYGTFLDVTTEVVGFRRIWARRRNTIQDAAGRVVGVITVDWIFTNREGNPTRIVPEMEAAFPGLARPLEMERLDLGDPPPTTRAQEYIVPAHQVDPRGHMNSAAYLDVFEDALVGMSVQAQERPATYELEYRVGVQLGNLLQRFIWAEPSGWAMLIAIPAGLPVAKGRRKAGLPESRHGSSMVSSL